MPVESPFRNAGENKFVVDWFDALSNVGYKSFYCCAEQPNAGEDYFLTTNSSTDAQPNETFFSTAGSLDIDFDISINVAKFIIAEGDAYINFTMYTPNKVAAFTITIKHVDANGTETALGSAITPNRSGAGNVYYRESLRIALSKKVFKIGEKLRITAYNSSGSAVADKKIYHDPASRVTVTDYPSGASVGTDFIVQIPVEVK